MLAGIELLLDDSLQLGPDLVLPFLLETLAGSAFIIVLAVGRAIHLVLSIRRRPLASLLSWSHWAVSAFDLTGFKIGCLWSCGFD
jgi:hypothetical protein